MDDRVGHNFEILEFAIFNGAIAGYLIGNSTILKISATSKIVKSKILKI